MKVELDPRHGLWPEAEGRRQFESGLSAGLRREWDSFSTESDPELLANAAFALAAKLEGRKQPQQAAFLLSGILDSSALSAKLRKKTQDRLAVLEGEGNWGSRFEALLSSLTQEAKNPGPLFAMAAAGIGFHLSRLAWFAKLQPQALRLASPLATLGEAAVFSATLPLFAKASPIDESLGPENYSAEFFSALLLLSSLRVSAWPLRFLPGMPRLPWLYGGVLLAQDLQRRCDLLPQAAPDAALLEGLALTLQLQAGAGLARAALGPKGMQFLNEVEWRQKTAPSGPRNFPNSTALAPSNPVLASPSVPSPAPFRAGIYAMSEGGSSRSRPPLRLVSPDPHEEFVQTFGNSRPFQEAYHRILNLYGSRHDGSKLRGLLQASEVRHPMMMNPGIQDLAKILQRAQQSEAWLPYHDWLVQKVYERVYFENRSPQALGELLLSLATRENVGALEQRLAPHFQELDLRGVRPMGTNLQASHQFQLEATKRLHEWRKFETEFAELPLTPASRPLVFRWKQVQADHYLGNMQVPFDRFIDDFFELGRGPQAVRVLEVNAAIEAAGQSPLGAARLSRLASLLRLHRGQVSSNLLEELGK